jgi:hypothetical protein
MTSGESCSYKIKSRKGSPCFKVSNDSTITDSKVNITFVEFNEKKVNKTNNTGSGENVSPREGMPSRNQSFENSGEQGNSTKGGQKMPKRRKGDGSMTNETDVSEEKEYIEKKDQWEQDEQDKEGEGGGWFNFGGGDKKKNREKGPKKPGKNSTNTTTFDGEKPRPRDGEGMNETEAVKGYGQPTKGSYNSTEKGYKTFGTEGQGPNKEGVKDSGSSKEENRSMYVSVTAVADQGSDTILLELGNYDFLEEYTWAEGAIAKAVSIGAIAMISFIMF